MKTINVNVSKSYDVLIGHSLLEHIGELIKPICKTNRVAIITDDIVEHLFWDSICQSLYENGFEAISYSFPNGERSKNIETLSGILEFLAEKRITRKDTLIALGGGVVGDIVGLAAAIYMRGMIVIQVPTTLLSAVDSSVGGKTAVDLKAGKNLVGAFWQPSMVVCDVDVIENLPDKIFNEGMSEVIKCTIIRKLPVTDWINANCLKEHLEEMIFECIQLKRDIVEKDEFDNKGIRNVLNVGHTIAHAIEKLSNYTISHGHAVGTGLIIEARIANELGKTETSVVEQIRNQVGLFGLVERIDWSPLQMVEAMKSDKKNADSSIVFELPLQFGETEELKIDTQALLVLMEKVLG